jgi:hypothetical protein
MGCRSSKYRRPGKRTLEDEGSAQTDEASDISSNSSVGTIPPVTREMAIIWLKVARESLALSYTQIQNRELMTPVFGLDTPGFGTLEDSMIIRPF